MIDRPSSDLQVVEAALGRLVFGQDEAGTRYAKQRAKVRPNKSQKSRKIFSFPSLSVKHNLLYVVQ
jgi:hypothetical protein